MRQDDDDEQTSAGQWALRGFAIVAGLGLLIALGFFVFSLMGKTTAHKPGPQQIALIKQPPPPPPKPPEKPPEPPKVKEEVKINEAKPVEPKPDDKPPDAKPASDKPLSVDADANGTGDSFGLAANKGGQDITTIGGGGGGGGSSGRYFTGLLQRNFFDALARNRKTPLQEFSVVISVWLGDDGRVQRTQIVNGSGNAELDDIIQTTLAEMAPLREVPPGNLRRIQLRLNRRA